MTEQEETPTPQLTESQAKRMNQPLVGIVITVAVTLLGVFAVMGLRPEQDVSYTPDENVGEAAGWTNDVTDYAAIVPDLPAEWSANYARWENRAELGVTAWEVGYSIDEQSFLSFAQTDEPNPAWVNEETGQAGAVGEETVNGLSFEIRENEDEDRRYYVLSAEENTIDGTAIVLGGTADDAEFETFLQAVTEAIDVEVETEDDDGGASE
ncbi:DUF4245 domain-containing protein [Nesterenkonia lutea]|uniref:DUF4245 domain-containing protein n=1 Tax=Nesterenkonia lutea TaxID=272919 RepID=A0ABR9JBM6_9MICC|nr:DUF4245 domain-containing protein [Nesterenkonia lutea]MBE1523330.1 hypothetical protein [Nesterenkonia lutea]